MNTASVRFNSNKKIYCIALLILSFMFLFGGTVYADYTPRKGEPRAEINNFSLSQDGGVKATYDQENRQLIISGAGTIDRNLWLDMVRLAVGKNDVGYWQNYDEDFDIIFAHENENDIALPRKSNALFGGFGNTWEGNDRGNVDFGKGVDTSGVTTMSYMFSSFDGNIEPAINFNTSNVTNMLGMFKYTKNIDKPVNFDIPKCVTVQEMFQQSSYNMPVTLTNASKLDATSNMFFNATAFNSPVEITGASKLRTVSHMFEGASEFNSPVTISGTSDKLVSASYMFYKASSFNNTLDISDTSNLKNVEMMFALCETFNQELNLDTSSASSFGGMFSGASKFNNGSEPGASDKPLMLSFQSAKNTNAMFQSCSSFNQPMPHLDLSKCAYPFSIFNNCILYNQDVTSENGEFDLVDNKFSWAVRMFSNCINYQHNIVVNVANVDSSLDSGGKYGENYELQHAFRGVRSKNIKVKAFKDDGQGANAVNDIKANGAFDGCSELESLEFEGLKNVRVGFPVTMYNEERDGFSDDFAVYECTGNVASGNSPNSANLPRVAVRRKNSVWSQPTDKNGQHYVVKVAPKVAITFNANDDSESPATKTQIDTITLAVPKLDVNTFTREGYFFEGWNTSADGTGTSYDDEATNFVMGEGDTTLYAKWTKLSYDRLFFEESVGDAIKGTETYQNAEQTKKTDYDNALNSANAVLTKVQNSTATQAEIDTATDNLVNAKIALRGDDEPQGDIYEFPLSDDENVKATYDQVNHKLKISGQGTIRIELWRKMVKVSTGKDEQNTWDNVEKFDIVFEGENKTDIALPVNSASMFYNFGDISETGVDCSIDFGVGVVSSAVENAYSMFRHTNCLIKNFDFDASSVVNLWHMFEDAKKFNQTINWNIPNCTTVESMFKGETAFNSPVTLTNAAKLETTAKMFGKASAFNSPVTISGTTPALKATSYMFMEAKKFNNTLNISDTSGVTNMALMFHGCSEFNQEFTLNTSSVSSYGGMFWGAKKFNNGSEAGQSDRDLTIAFTDRVNTNSMFQDCSSFNQKLPNLNLSKCHNPSSMFRRCTLYNQDIAGKNGEFDREDSDFYYLRYLFDNCINYQGDIVVNASGILNENDQLQRAFHGVRSKHITVKAFKDADSDGYNDIDNINAEGAFDGCSELESLEFEGLKNVRVGFPVTMYNEERDGFSDDFAVYECTGNVASGNSPNFTKLPRAAVRRKNSVWTQPTDKNGQHYVVKVAPKVDISFNANDGSESPATKTQTDTITLAVPKLDKNTFTRAGYVFEGWNTSADGSGTSYSDEATNFVMSETDTTLYAIWTKLDWEELKEEKDLGDWLKNHPSYSSNNETVRSEFEAALLHAKAVLAKVQNSTASQVEVDNAYTQLLAKRNTLSIEIYDVSALRALASRNIRNTALYYNENNESRQQAYDRALKNANTVLDKVHPSSEEVNDAYYSLFTAIERLSGSATNNASLKDLIMEYEEVKQSAKYRNGLEEEQKAYDEIIAKSRPVQESTKYSQIYVDEVIEAILIAKGNLSGVEEELTEEDYLVVDGKKFVDVKKKDWFAQGVYDAVDKNIMEGTSENEFSPNVDTSRGMVVTIIHRMSKDEVVNSESILNYDDVESDKYYTEPVKWATTMSIVRGYGDSTFKPMKAVSRQELISMLHKYTLSKGYKLVVDDELKGFVDADKVHDYAKEGMNWAVREGIIKGVGMNRLSPTTAVTRAEASLIFTRYMEKYADR